MKVLTELTKRFKKSDASNKDSLLSEIAYFSNMAKNGVTVSINDNTALTRIFTGQKMYVDTRDVSVSPHLMLEGYWEMEITQIMLKLLNPSYTFIDMGANSGYFGVIAGTVIRAQAGGKIISFEANPDYIHLIEKCISVNGLDDRMKVENLAISDSRGQVKLQRYKDLWGSSSISEKVSAGYEIDKTFTIESIAFDEYCNKNNIDQVDFVKMDIEGVEDKAYKGMKKTIKNNPQIKLLIEFSLMRYQDPEGFYNSMARDFKYIYAIIGSQSRLINSYKELVEAANADWVMILTSNSTLQI